MTNKFTPQDFDQQIQIQLDVVTKILSATAQSQDAAKSAMTALHEMRTNVERSLNSLAQDLHKKLDSSVEKTATEAASLLQEKFLQADHQAILAAARYEKAGRWLGLKLFMILLLILATVLGVAWLMVTQIVPTPEEIKARMDEVAVLETRVSDLDKRGAHLIWSYCGEGKEQALCFQTQSNWNAKNGPETYAVPAINSRKK